MPTQAFEVLRGTIVLSGGSATGTITESTDYTLPTGADSTNCFIRITNTRITGMGNNAAGGNQNDDDTTVSIQNPGNIATSITFERDGTANTCHVTYEIICYVGVASGANEFIVRGVGTVSGTAAQLTGTTLTNITDNGDCIVVITGQRTANTGRNDAHYRLWTASLVANASNWDPQFDRDSTATASTNEISYAVIEFTGSNWTVDRFEFTTTGTAWTTTDNTSFTVAHGVTVADAAKAGVFEMQYSTSNDSTGLDDAGDAFYLDDTTNLRVWNRATAGARRKVAWILQNSQADGSARNLKVQHVEYRDDTTSGAEPRGWTFNLTTDPDSGSGSTLVAPLDETSLVGSASVDGTGTAFPRGAIDYRLTGTNEITFRESDNGQERRIAMEVFEWPEDPDSGVTEEPGAGAITITGQIPTITVSDNLSEEPGAGSLSLTGQAPARGAGFRLEGLVPTISIGAADLIEEPGAGSLSLTGEIPTAQTTNNLVIGVPAGSLSLSGEIPAEVRVSITVVPDVGAVTITGHIPTLDLTANLTRAPPQGSLTLAGAAPDLAYSWTVFPTNGGLTLTGLIPTAGASDDKVAEPSAGGLTLTGLVPSVSISDNLTVSPETGTLTLTGYLEYNYGGPGLRLIGYEPSVSQGFAQPTAQPGAGSLSLTGYIPTLNIDSGSIIEEPGAGSLTLTGLAPTISRTENWVAEPGSGSLTLTGLTPTAGDNKVAQPGAGSLALTGLAPSVLVSLSEQPGTGSLSLTGYIPTLNVSSGDITAQPGAGSLTLTGQTPTAVSDLGSQTVFPETGSLNLTGYLEYNYGGPGLRLIGYEPSLGNPSQLTSVVLFTPLNLETHAPAIEIGITGADSSLGLTGYAPSVSASQAGIPSGSLTLTGQTPQLDLTGSSDTVNPPVGALTIESHAPAVEIIIFGADSSLGLTGYEPSLEFTWTALPDAYAFSLTGYEPTALVESNAQTTPVPVGGASLSGSAPTLGISDNITVQPGSGALTLTGYAFTAATTGTFISVLPLAGELDLTGHAPKALGEKAEEPPSGGYDFGWREIEEAIERSRRFQRKQQKARRKKAKRFKETLDRDLVMEMIRQQEAQEREEELTRLTNLVKKNREALIKAADPRLTNAIDTAIERTTFGAMERLEREIDEYLDLEAFLIQATLIILENQ